MMSLLLKFCGWFFSVSVFNPGFQPDTERYRQNDFGVVVLRTHSMLVGHSRDGVSGGAGAHCHRQSGKSCRKARAGAVCDDD